MAIRRGQVVVVTGASAGIGRAVATHFGSRGAKVGLLARGGAGLAGAAKDVVAAGGEALELPTDVASHDELEAAARRVEEAFGPIDVWVNDAVASVFAPFTQISAEEFRRVTEVSYLGFVYGTMVALRRMLPRGRGTIVQVGSTLAYRGVPLQTAHGGAKHAVQGFNEALRCELLHARSRVHVTMVQLPTVNTPQFDWALFRLPGKPRPRPPVYSPEVAARAVLYAADHPRRREYWVGGSTVLTLIVNAVAPGLLDRYLAATAFGPRSTAEPADPDHLSNLWAAVDGRDGHDHGPHGRFESQEHLRSSQVWASQRHGLFVGVAAGAAGIAAAVVDRRIRLRAPRTG